MLLIIVFILQRVRNLIAIFFLLVFSVQALPFKMVGKAMGKNQQTEEVQDDDCKDTDDDGKDCSKDEKYNHFPHHTGIAVAFCNTTRQGKTTRYYTNDDLPSSYVRDILSPPPNC